jgi:hypothetical protein
MKKIIEQEWMSRGKDSRLITVGWEGTDGFQNWAVPDIDWMTETETKRQRERNEVAYKLQQK